jgi:hypothetical protein
MIPTRQGTVRRDGRAAWGLRLALVALVALGAALSGVGRATPARAEATRGTVAAWGWSCFGLTGHRHYGR